MRNKKSKIEALTGKSGDYVSEKMIKIGNRSVWLIKVNDKIQILDGNKILYDGSSYNFHKWLRIAKEKAFAEESEW